MKISVKSLRILFIVGNCALAIALLLHWASNVAPDALNKAAPWLFKAKTETADVEIRPASDFKPVEGRVQAPDTPRKMVGPAQWLQPKPPPVRLPPTNDDKPTEVVQDDPVVPEGEAIPGGPLAERDWIFTQVFVNYDNPLETLVKLEKKPPEEDDKSKAGSSRSRSSSRTSSRARSRIIGARGSSRGRSSARGKSRGGSDPVWFKVIERRIQIPEENEDENFEFYIHAADGAEMLYWADDDPKRMYKLEMHDESFIAKARLTKTLGPDPDDEEEEEEEDEDRGRIERVPHDYEDLRERDYQRLFAGIGKKKISASRARSGGGKTAPTKADELRRKEADAAKGKNSKDDAKKDAAAEAKAKLKADVEKQKAAAAERAKNGEPAPEVGTQREVSAEEIKELGNTLGEIEKSGKLSPEEREQVEELKRTLTGDKKK